MQHRFYGSPVKSPIGESSFITYVQCALINFTLNTKSTAKITTVSMILTYFTFIFYLHHSRPHTFYSFDQPPIFIVGGGTHVFSDPPLQHPTPGKPQMLLQKPLICYFVAFINNREIEHIIGLTLVEGISFAFSRRCVSLRKHPFLLALRRWDVSRGGNAKRPQRRRARRNGCFRRL